MHNYRPKSDGDGWDYDGEILPHEVRHAWVDVIKNPDFVRGPDGKQVAPCGTGLGSIPKGVDDVWVFA